MPKIEVYREALLRSIGDIDLTDDQLEQMFPRAKAELDEAANSDGIMKVELNDTNRPDLWSTAGLGRQLRIARTGVVPSYDFFSSADHRMDDGGRKIHVDASVERIRPFIVGFAISGPAIDEAMLNDLIQTQEKLTWNFGRKRRSVAMGVYRSDLMRFPVHYAAVDPDTTRFVPLSAEKEMSMREMLTDHPKGAEFGHIVADFPSFPLLTDDGGGVLSFPPVINSNAIGAVQEGDSNLFVELTGTDMDSLLLTASIVACDVHDRGYTVLPVTVEYPYDTPYGRSITVPYYFQAEQSSSRAQIRALLGSDLANEEIEAALRTMGVESQTTANSDDPIVTIRVPEYRNDFLHAVDIVEDVMIGRGMDQFEPTMPQAFTVGRLTAVEECTRRLKFTMVGLGFQEMIFNYLGSASDYIERMYPESEWGDAASRAVQIANPMSENYEFVRPSILPSLLSAEAVSGKAAYPHHVFEIGNVAERDDSDPSGTRTLTVLGFVSADREAGFNLANSHISAILYYLGYGYGLRAVADSRFIPGRAAEIVLENGRSVGRFGEVHPRVLEQWGIQVPCTGGEIDLASLISVHDRNSTG